MPETTKATATDAELILRIYDLRREEKIRKARDWFGGEFWPNSFEDVQRLMGDFENPANVYFRQVLSYWDMACALVLHGTVNPSLFYDTNGEVAFVYCKMKPFIQQMRQTMNAPEFMANTERLCESTPEWRERVNRMTGNIAHFREMREQQKRTKAA
jgi:hypothetical protein